MRKQSKKQSKLKVGNDIGSDVEHSGIVILELDYGFSACFRQFFLCTFV